MHPAQAVVEPGNVVVQIVCRVGRGHRHVLEPESGPPVFNRGQHKTIGADTTRARADLQQVRATRGGDVEHCDPASGVVARRTGIGHIEQIGPGAKRQACGVLPHRHRVGQADRLTGGERSQRDGHDRSVVAVCHQYRRHAATGRNHGRHGGMGQGHAAHHRAADRLIKLRAGARAVEQQQPVGSGR